ncbi:MAG: hypothetical protein ACI3V0_12540 [Faecousia sp.]
MTRLFSQTRRGCDLRFWLTAMAAAGLIFSTYLQPMLEGLRQGGGFYEGYHNELICTAFSSDTLAAFLPALAAIPLSAGYLEDMKSKVSRFSLIRGSYSDYLFGNCIACWLCGGGAVLLGAISAWGITTTIFLPLERVLDNPPELGMQIVAQLTLLFLNGGLWAVLGITMSTIMESKYIAYASPFIVYYLLVILYERYFPNAWLLYPKNWLNPEIWPYGVGSAALFLLELTFLCGLVFYVRGKRRLEQL